MSKERYTFMQHDIRKHFKLSMEEYAVLDAIYCLSRNQPCNAKAEYFVKLFDICERSYYNIRKTLLDKGLTIKTGNGVKTTAIWDDAMAGRVAQWPDSPENGDSVINKNSNNEEKTPSIEAEKRKNPLQNLQSNSTKNANCEICKVNSENDFKNCSEPLRNLQLVTENFAVHNNEINNEININNTSNKDLELSAFAAIDKIFRIGSEKLTGQVYYRDGKEAKHIKLLEARYKNNPDEFRQLAFKFYCMISEVEDDFFNKQPFTPSAFNSLYNRIRSYQLPTQTRKQHEQTKRSEWDELLDRYGVCDDRELNYFLRCNQLSQEEVDYIKKHRIKKVGSA